MFAFLCFGLALLRVVCFLRRTRLGSVGRLGAAAWLGRGLAKLGQGGKLEHCVQQPDAIGEEVLPQFIPLPLESRVGFPPADAPGKGETRVREVGDSMPMLNMGSRALADQ